MAGQPQGAVTLDVPARNDHMAAACRDFGHDGSIAEFGHETLKRLHVFRDNLYFRVDGVGLHFRDVHPEGAHAVAVRGVEFQGLFRGGAVHEEQEEHDAQRNQGDDGHRKTFSEWSDVHASFSFLPQG